MRFDEQGAAHASFIIKPDTLLSNKQFAGQAFARCSLASSGPDVSRDHFRRPTAVISSGFLSVQLQEPELGPSCRARCLIAIMCQMDSVKKRLVCEDQRLFETG